MISRREARTEPEGRALTSGQYDGSAVVPEPPAVFFIAPPRFADARGASFLGRRTSKPKDRPMIADEEGARRALGSDGGLPSAVLAGDSIEHLARIALG